MRQLIITISIVSIFLSHNCVVGQTYPIADAQFKSCIEQSFTGMLDAQDDLILSQAALPDTLDCSSFNISNADGLQHFTNLRVIDLHDNKFTHLDELTTLTAVNELYLQENELIELPDLSNSSALFLIKATNNFITTSSPLPPQLRSLDLSQNNLNTFGNLSELPELFYLNLSRNTNLKSLPALDGLSNLKELHCYLCGLDSLPSTAALTQLEFLNIGYNKFTGLPDFSSNVNLKTLYVNDCFLTSFPDMSMLPLLEKVRLYNNHLSFEDFMPLLVNPTYSEIYKITPQWSFNNPLKSNYFEYDSVSFTTGIATSTTGVTYTWYVDGEVLNTSTSDTFSIDSIQIENSGLYNFVVTHTLFPDLTLFSDTQKVTVSSCLNPSGFQLDITGATCQTAGSLRIKAPEQPQENLTYQLQSTATDRVFNSKNGVFQNLSNPHYKLYAQASPRCIKLIDDTIEVPIEKCKDAFFTPNNDGVDDNFYFEQVGEAKIYNKWGQLIQTLSIPSEWDGELNDSKKITPGYYTININDGEEIFHLSVVY